MTEADAQRLIEIINAVTDQKPLHSPTAGESYFNSYLNGAEKSTAVFQRLATIDAKQDLPLSSIAYVSIGGADGSELASAFERPNVTHGLLLEFDQDVVHDFPQQLGSSLPTGLQRKLNNLVGLQKVRVLTGDAWGRRAEANLRLREWFARGEITLALFSIQSVLHELPTRSGSKEYSHLTFLSSLFDSLPAVVMVCREPSHDPTWSGVLDFNAARQDVAHHFAKFARFLADRYPGIFGFRNTRVIQEHLSHLTIDGSLALEVAKKLAYALADNPAVAVEKLRYEVEECHAALDRDEFYSSCQALFPFPHGHLSRSDDKSANFMDLWSRTGFQARSPSLNRVLPTPAPFVELLGHRLSPSSTDSYATKPPGEKREVRLPTTEEGRISEGNSRSLNEKELLTVSGSRFELTPQQLRFAVSDKKFVMSFPESARLRMLNAAPSFVIRDPASAPFIEAMMTDAETLVPDVRDVLRSAAIEAAEALIRKAEIGDAVFNAEVFNVLRMPTGADNEENATVLVELYRTDYFSLQTLLIAFRSIKARNQTHFDFRSSGVRHALRLFRTGFGLNCTVCVVPRLQHARRPDYAGMLIFGRRSERAGKTASTGTWHVTANEALTVKDLVDQQINLSGFISRALHEEAGLKSDQIKRSFVLAIFLYLTDMQPGLSVISFCEVENVMEAFYRIDGSMDGTIEYDEHVTLPFTNAAIQHALDQGGLPDRRGSIIPFSATADNLLRSVLARGVLSFSYD